MKEYGLRIKGKHYFVNCRNLKFEELIGSVKDAIFNLEDKFDVRGQLYPLATMSLWMEEYEDSNYEAPTRSIKIIDSGKILQEIAVAKSKASVEDACHTRPYLNSPVSYCYTVSNSLAFIDLSDIREFDIRKVGIECKMAELPGVGMTEVVSNITYAGRYDGIEDIDDVGYLPDRIYVCKYDGKSIDASGCSVAELLASLGYVAKKVDALEYHGNFEFRRKNDSVDLEFAVAADALPNAYGLYDCRESYCTNIKTGECSTISCRGYNPITGELE